MSPAPYQPPSPYQTPPRQRQDPLTRGGTPPSADSMTGGRQGRIDEQARIDDKGLRTAVALSTASCSANGALVASPGDFAVVDVDASFRQHAHAPLRFGRRVTVQVVDIGCLVRDFEVPNHTVSLEQKESAVT